MGNDAQHTSSLSGAGFVNGYHLEGAPETTGSAYLEFTHPTPRLEGGHSLLVLSMYPREKCTFCSPSAGAARDLLESYRLPIVKA